ncbi:sarcosine oxidase [Murinocardiopsis flavida]|uniref:Sarcosine oxidase n=1 Tax=Murinocardiopsis flavida TaxID=645275 RepID=A0A2P8DQY0_9ACTN|nr:N-methyl-L-tryptophan oxidase [Murinocardiopsis flavida]PSK99621.1 sarcosine oxidase [Murinocardiopsis flavida]
MPTQHPPRVAIVGAGTIGTMAAWRLAARGAQVLAFDHFAPGHDRGAAGGESRIFRTAYMEGRGYIPALRSAAGLWRRLEQETGTSLLRMCGAMTIGAPDDPAMRELRAGAEEHGLDHEVLGPVAAADRYPQHPLRTGETAFLDPAAGVIRPDLALIAAARRAAELGAAIAGYTPVTRIEPRGGGWMVSTGDTAHDVDAVVLAPGAWGAAEGPAHAMLAGFGLVARQITLHWFPARDPGALTPEHNPVVIRVGDPAYSCFPVMDGVSVKVSTHSAPRPDVGSPDGLARSSTPELLAATRAIVRDHLPALHPDPVRIAAYADAFTPDGHAVLGALPGSPGLYAAAGFSGHGFKLSPLFGDALADLVVDGATRHDISRLDPARRL